MGKTVTEFVLYSGLHTIGGVIASVTYGKSRVILEFGAAFNPKAPVYDKGTDLRPNYWIQDLLKLGILPRIEGIYRRADLGGDPLVSAEESSLQTTVFVSHLHLDHMALIGALAPQVPVYLHHNAQIIERALEDTGDGIPTLPRSYRNIKPFEPICIGEIEVLPLLCRDTSYYDFAFLVTTPDGTVHWTGDLCLNGMQADKTLSQMKLLKQKNIDVMLCDATAFSDPILEMIYGFSDVSLIRPDLHVPANMLSEEQRRKAIRSKITNCRGLCVFNYYPREMDDAEMLIECAGGAGRRCVFEPDAAYIIKKFFHSEPYVYFPDSERYPAENMPRWQRELLDGCTVVTPEEVSADPAGYLLQNSFRHIMELFGFPNEQGVYIHAGGNPIGEFDPAYQNMCRIVEKAGFAFSAFQENYTGHSYPGQAKYFVDFVDPKVLIPCHSYHPERLLPLHGEQCIPERNKVYILENHRFYPRSDGVEE
jgi:ribonuclease J